MKNLTELNQELVHPGDDEMITVTSSAENCLSYMNALNIDEMTIAMAFPAGVCGQRHSVTRAQVIRHINKQREVK